MHWAYDTAVAERTEQEPTKLDKLPYVTGEGSIHVLVFFLHIHC